MFEQRLRNTRQAKGMTQQALAEQLFVSRKTVSSWETGRNLPNLETLSQLAEILNVSTDYLLGRQTATSKPLKLTGLSTVFALVAVARFAIATTSQTLWLGDAVLVVLLALLVANRRSSKHTQIRLVAMLVGMAMIGSAWGQIFGMDLGNQLVYVVAGSLLTSESTWLICRERFQSESGVVNHPRINSRACKSLSPRIL